MTEISSRNPHTAKPSASPLVVTISVPRPWQLAALGRMFATAVEADFSYISQEHRRRIIHQNNLPRLVAALMNPKRVVLVATVGGRLCGYAIGGLPEVGQGHIDWLYVDPKRRRHNIGMNLLTRIVAELRRRGARTASLVTYNHTAFYARQGFVIKAKIQCDGLEQDLMDCKL